MAQVLQLAHLVEHHGVADVDIRGGGVQAQLDAQRHTSGFGAGQLALPFVLRKQFFDPAQRNGHGMADGVGNRLVCNN